MRSTRHGQGQSRPNSSLTSDDAHSLKLNVGQHPRLDITAARRQLTKRNIPHRTVQRFDQDMLVCGDDPSGVECLIDFFDSTLHAVYWHRRPEAG
jgi:hypothetical protein